MKLETDRVTIEDVTAEQLRAAIDLLDGVDNSRAILSRSDDVYLQTAWFNNGFVVEKREGSEAAHFYAVPPYGPLAPVQAPPKRNWFQRLFASPDFLTSECAFRKADMIGIFTAYHDGKDASLALDWREGFCDR